MNKALIVKQFEYDGLGFPVLLLNVPVREFRGVLAPDIDYNLLQRNLLLALARKPSPLTGNEVRFIRQFAEMTFAEFANSFGVAHSAVIHWEKSKNAFAKITPTTELCIRLFILDQLKADNKIFRTMFREFDYSKFTKAHIEKEFKDAQEFISIDTSSLKSL